MPLDYDKIKFTSLTPALMEVDRGSFDISITGTITAGSVSNFSGTAGTDIKQGSVKTYFQQTPVPASALIHYDATALVPIPPYGGYSPYPRVGCSVSGSPSVTSIEVFYNGKLNTSTGLDVTLTISNPYAGTMTLTDTAFTIRYVVYAPSFET